MQLFDIVVCLQHMLAHHSVLWYMYSPDGYRSDSPQSSHAVLPNLTLPAQGDRRQPLDSPVFQADLHSRSPLIQYTPWMF